VGGQEHVFDVGPHAPHLTPKEIDMLHGIWLELSSEMAPEELHHHDIVLRRVTAGAGEGGW